MPEVQRGLLSNRDKISPGDSRKASVRKLYLRMGLEKKDQGVNQAKENVGEKTLCREESLSSRVVIFGSPGRLRGIK